MPKPIEEIIINLQRQKKKIITLNDLKNIIKQSF
jgi:hypothetical protein